MMRNRRFAWIALALLLPSGGCGLGGNPHEERGDNYFQAGRYEDAFAEYAVALRQGGEDPAIYRKMGRTGIQLGNLKETRKAYFALLRLSPEESDMVAIDFFRLGIDFYEKGDDVQMARAFESLFDVDSTYNIGEYAYYLADYYQEQAEFEKAARFYTRALSYRPDHEKVAEATYRLALSHEKLENFRDALVYYEQLLRRFPDRAKEEPIEWHRGLCAYEVALEEFEEGDPEEALGYLRIPLSTHQPQVKEDDAWFLAGEIYREIGQVDSALVAYGRVLELNPSRSGRLVSLSRQRISDIKFGR
jgi:tetratricopeptide (TPR) repeat protein